MLLRDSIFLGFLSIIDNTVDSVISWFIFRNVLVISRVPLYHEAKIVALVSMFLFTLYFVRSARLPSELAQQLPVRLSSLFCFRSVRRLRHSCSHGVRSRVLSSPDVPIKFSTTLLRSWAPL